MGCVGASNARRTFHAVNRQLGSPGKPGVPDLASAAIRNASRSLVQHQAPLQLKHWPHLPRVDAFQASSQLLSIADSPVTGCKGRQKQTNLLFVLDHVL